MSSHTIHITVKAPVNGPPVAVEVSTDYSDRAETTIIEPGNWAEITILDNHVAEFRIGSAE